MSELAPGVSDDAQAQKRAACALVELRLQMTAEGWESHDRISTMGWRDQMGFSIWFQRWDWHGEPTLGLVGREACYHAHTGDLQPSAMLAAAERAAQRARQAYTEHPECPPEQRADGSLLPTRPLLLRLAAP